MIPPEIQIRKDPAFMPGLFFFRASGARHHWFKYKYKGRTRTLPENGMLRGCTIQRVQKRIKGQCDKQNTAIKTAVLERNTLLDFDICTKG